MDNKETQPRDEGYIKFNCNWKKEPLSTNRFPIQALEELIKYRQLFYDLNLIGVYEDGIGFGNISILLNQGNFLISGSATGNIQCANKEHFSLVTNCDSKNNTVDCSGPVKASSESMTHDMFYRLDPDIKVVVHAHHPKLWNNFLFKLPTTEKNIPYGTPEMAAEIKRLYEQDELKASKTLVMAGHDEGIISFGANFNEVKVKYQSLLEKI